MQPERDRRFQFSLKALLLAMAVLAFVAAGAKDGNAVGVANAVVFVVAMAMTAASLIMRRESLACGVLMGCGAYLLAASFLVGIGQIFKP